MKKLILGAVITGSLGTAGAAQWQYGTMTIVTANEGRVFYWKDKNQSITQNRMEDFWLSLTKRAWNAKTAPYPINLNDFLDFLGSNGWELISVSGGVKLGEAQLYYFKRPVVK